MKYLKMENYSEFECIGSVCPDTCCTDWTIIVDENSYTKYKQTDSSYGQFIMDNIKTENGTHIIELANNRCPHLNEENLCNIYTNLGKDALCETCKIYPRYIFSYGELQIWGLNMSCPEVVSNLYKMEKPIEFDFGEDSVLPNNELKIGWDVYNAYISAFVSCIELMQQRKMGLSDRIKNIIYIATEMNNAENDINTLNDIITKIKYIPTEKKTKNHPNPQSWIRFMQVIIDTIKNFGANHFIIEDIIEISKINLSEIDIKQLYEEFTKPDYNNIFEKWCVCYLFKFFLKACFENKHKIFAYDMAYIYCMHIWIFIAKYINNDNITFNQKVFTTVKLSKFFDHSNELSNFNKIYDCMEKNNLATLEFISEMIP